MRSLKLMRILGALSFLLFLSVSTRAFSFGIALISSGDKPGGDTCTGAKIFSWHMENIDVTLGTPHGCSVGDTIATLGTDHTPVISSTIFQDGGYSLYCPGSNAYAAFSIVDSDIFNPPKGTVRMRMYLVTKPSIWGKWFAVPIDSSNNFEISQDGGNDEVKLNYKGNGSSVDLVTTDANFAQETWYTVTAKYDTADVDPNLWLQVCDENNENCCTAVTSNTNLTAWVGTPAQIEIGNHGWDSQNSYFDNIQIYNDWLP